MVNNGLLDAEALGEADGDPLLCATSEKEANGLGDAVAEGYGDAPSESEADGLADCRGLLDDDRVGEAEGDPLWNKMLEEKMEGLGDGVAEGFGDVPLFSSDVDGLGD